MAKNRANNTRQPYPREDNNIAKSELFPKMNPPLPYEAIREAIDNAFVRSRKTKTGDVETVPSTPEDLAKLCMKHLKERADPILGTSFYSQLHVDEIFDMDAIPHEVHRLRMKLGIFYQYLLIELMRSSMKHGNERIIQVFDGMEEGDIVADVLTPGFDKNLRLYISVKKSADTVGGQDVEGVIERIENLPKTEKNRTSPYLCVFAIATPSNGKDSDYEKSRKIKRTKKGDFYSENCETWKPGFIFPYITGRSSTEIYKKCVEYFDLHFPFYSLKHRDECAVLVKEELIKLGIASEDGTINKDNFFEYMVKDY